MRWPCSKGCRVDAWVRAGGCGRTLPKRKHKTRSSPALDVGCHSNRAGSPQVKAERPGEQAPEALLHKGPHSFLLGVTSLVSALPPHTQTPPERKKKEMSLRDGTFLSKSVSTPPKGLLSCLDRR